MWSTDFWVSSGIRGMVPLMPKRTWDIGNCLFCLARVRRAGGQEELLAESWRRIGPRGAFAATAAAMACATPLWNLALLFTTKSRPEMMGDSGSCLPHTWCPLSRRRAFQACAKRAAGIVSVGWGNWSRGRAGPAAGEGWRLLPTDSAGSGVSAWRKTGSSSLIWVSAGVPGEALSDGKRPGPTA